MHAGTLPDCPNGPRGPALHSDWEDNIMGVWSSPVTEWRPDVTSQLRIVSKRLGSSPASRFVSLHPRSSPARPWDLNQYALFLTVFWPVFTTFDARTTANTLECTVLPVLALPYQPMTRKTSTRTTLGRRLHSHSDRYMAVTPADTFIPPRLRGPRASRFIPVHPPSSRFVSSPAVRPRVGYGRLPNSTEW